MQILPGPETINHAVLVLAPDGAYSLCHLYSSHEHADQCRAAYRRVREAALVVDVSPPLSAARGSDVWGVLDWERAALRVFASAGEARAFAGAQPFPESVRQISWTFPESYGPPQFS